MWKHTMAIHPYLADKDSIKQHLLLIRLGAVFTHQKEDFRKDLILNKVRYERYTTHIIII